MPPDLIVVNDRADKEATEQLTITSKTVLINTGGGGDGGGGGGTDVSDYGRATAEDLRDFFFRTATETAPATASSVYFEPEVARTTTESTENREGEDQTTTKTPATTPAAATIPPKYFEVFDYPSSTTAESQSSTATKTPKSEETTPAPISSVYFDPEVRSPRTTTAAPPPAALQAAVSDPEVIWYGDWEPAAAAAGDDEGDTERYPPPQYEVIYFTDVNPSSKSESPTATTTSTSTTTTTTTTTASPTTSASHTSQRISTETQVRI